MAVDSSALEDPAGGRTDALLIKARLPGNADAQRLRNRPQVVDAAGNNYRTSFLYFDENAARLLRKRLVRQVQRETCPSDARCHFILRQGLQNLKLNGNYARYQAL